MRKFNISIALDPSDFSRVAAVAMIATEYPPTVDKDLNVTVRTSTVLFRDVKLPKYTPPKFTEEETFIIDLVNNILHERSMEPMIETEKEIMFDPYYARFNKELALPIPTLEEIQRLAGFSVEKKITYYDRSMSPAGIHNWD